MSVKGVAFLKILEVKDAAFGWFQSLPLFSIEHLRIDDGAKILLAGRNGAGKSTLLRVLCGEEKLTKGEMTVKAGSVIIRLEQTAFYEGTVRNIFDELFSAVIEAENALRQMEKQLEVNGDEYSLRKYAKLCDAFEGFGGYQYLTDRSTFIQTFGLSTKLDVPFGRLSGGEQQYVRLAKTIFSQCDLMLLDEPFSFLDKEKQGWLLDFLVKSKTAYVIVCHEEEMIRGAASQTIEIANGKVKQYRGDVHIAHEQKRAAENTILHTNKDNLKRIESKRQEIERRRQWLKTAEEKRLHAVVIRRLEREILSLQTALQPSLYESISATDFEFPFDAQRWDGDELVIDIADVTVAYGPQIILNSFELTVHMHEHILIRGSNGSGKTTLIRLLMSEIKAVTGQVWKHPKLQIGLMRQIASNEYSRLTVQQYCCTVKKMGLDAFEKNKEVFWKGKEEIGEKRMYMLSGGERRKIELMLLMSENYDLLILDEPTAGLDEHAAQSLLYALNRYAGAVLLVLHDNAAIDRFNADKVICIDNSST